MKKQKQKKTHMRMIELYITYNLSNKQTVVIKEMY